jgi:hypothetical protein
MIAKLSVLENRRKSKQMRGVRGEICGSHKDRQGSPSSAGSASARHRRHYQHGNPLETECEGLLEVAWGVGAELEGKKGRDEPFGSGDDRGAMRGDLRIEILQVLKDALIYCCRAEQRLVVVERLE